MAILNALDRLLVVLSAIALMTLMMLITVSVFGRYFANTPVPDDLVLSEVLLVFVGFLPLAQVQANREHIFVSVFTDWMSNAAKVVFEMIGQIIGVVFFALVAAAVYTDFYAAWDSGAYYLGEFEVPEWPGKLVVVIGVGLFALRLALDTILDLWGLFTGTAQAAASETERVLSHDEFRE